ncbi:hypothetical protein CDAR_57971 [Caerostris darwini]|uniref:Uncharacterized protein n=1 Tax=Caerostris darwini TaxID=1538125 RepID=A0AAV4U6W2_9ARAC|nr:hypothetical protein CDAR_57971 [Caerostris darwini]
MFQGIVVLITISLLTLGQELNEKLAFHIAEKHQHDFAFTLHHPELLWLWGVGMLPLLVLSFAFWLVMMAPRLITCHNSVQEIFGQHDIGADAARTIPCEVTPDCAKPF